MNNNISLKTVFYKIFPFLSIASYIIIYAVIFDTFNLDYKTALYNIILSLPLFCFFLIITRRFHVATLTSTIALFTLLYIDQFVFSARLTHIRFSDFKLFLQAARVANRYTLIWNIDLTKRLGTSILICAFLFFIYYYYRFKYSWKTAIVLGLGLFIASVAVIYSGIIPYGGKEGFNFTVATEERGLLYSWYSQAQGGKLDIPEGYNKEKAETLLNQYSAIESTNDIRSIIIMNESFSDYSLLGNTHFDEPLTFIHRLVNSGKAFEGKLAVSVFAGGTANTEFEFLTGHSMAFLPEGSTPYLQYVNQNTANITSDIGNVSKVAIHPYYSEEWNRSQIYRFFGFDKFISGVDFGSKVETNGKSSTSRPSDNIVSFGEGPLYIRGLISDQTCFERILEEKANFTFAVTMQNHGDYSYIGDDFKNTAYITTADRREWTVKPSENSFLYSVNSNNTEQEVQEVNQYLTLSNLSDRAFAYLLGELEKSDQKTIVLMFGDHQPGLMIPEHYVDCEESPDMDYIVPYILWANYDIEFDAPEYTSPNYLSAILKKNAELPLTAWDQFRLDAMQEYPVVTANFILDKDGKLVGKDSLKDYELVQYMRMFDS